MKLPPLALALLIASMGAGGQTVVRCPGNVYTTQPCPGGAPVDMPPAPSQRERQEAARAAQREAELAGRLSRERAQREARQQPAVAVGIRGERGVPIEPTPTASQKANAPRKEGRRREKRNAPRALSRPASAP